MSYKRNSNASSQFFEVEHRNGNNSNTVQTNGSGKANMVASTKYLYIRFQMRNEIPTVKLTFVSPAIEWD